MRCAAVLEGVDLVEQVERYVGAIPSVFEGEEEAVRAERRVGLEDRSDQVLRLLHRVVGDDRARRRCIAPQVSALRHQSSSPLVSPTLLCVWSRRDDLPSVRSMLFDNGPLLVQWRRRPRPPGTWIVVLITLVGCLFAVVYAHLL